MLASMHPESMRTEARELVRAGTSLSQTSQTLGVARSTIRKWLRDERATPGCPAPLSPSPEYSALFGYYLGDGCVSRMSRAFSLRISCDARLPGIVGDVESVIKAVHP
ncbi:MAG: helix-turn-helix domain-containing protein, partial [Myxococcales bacterium]